MPNCESVTERPAPRMQLTQLESIRRYSTQHWLLDSAVYSVEHASGLRAQSGGLCHVWSMPPACANNPEECATSGACLRLARTIRRIVPLLGLGDLMWEAWG